MTVFLGTGSEGLMQLSKHMKIGPQGFQPNAGDLRGMEVPKS